MKKPAKTSALVTTPEPGRQYAALPYRDRDGLEVLLLTSRESRRWIIPKGWPMVGKPPYAAAAREAVQEAGVVGRVSKRPVGEFHYIKRLRNGAPLQCVVDVFPLKVVKQRTHWREQKERTVHWFTPLEAAELVDEPELRALILGFIDTYHRAVARKQAKAVKSVTASEIEAETPEEG
jgi:8-oxo-dGTP pyrophosphatase MutT (NUDIX family)